MAIQFNRDSAVTLVGAGKIAYTLGRELGSAGYNFNSVYSKSFSSARELAFYLELDNCSDLTGLSPDKYDVYFLPVPDSQISEIAQFIAETDTDLSGKLFVHLSGSKSSRDLKLLADKGAITASMHIMQTFPQREEVELTDCFCALESDTQVAIDYLREFCDITGLKSFTLSAGEKVYYHLAGVMAANFVNANFMASQITSAKIKNIPDIINLSYPTALRTMMNVKHKGVSEALSGPVQRNDLETVREHVKALKNLMVSEEQAEDSALIVAYLSQSLLLVSAAEGRGEDIDYTELRKYLKDELKNAINSL